MKKYFKKNIGLYLIVFAVFTWAISFVLLRFHAPFLSERGQIGDSFGAINALFSGLAFAGVIYTVYLQRKELKLQRKEQKLQRKEFEQQNKTLRFQRFENTFFNLVTLHHQIVDSIVGGFMIRSRDDNSAYYKDFEKRDFFKHSFEVFTCDYVGNKSSSVVCGTQNTQW